MTPLLIGLVALFFLGMGGYGLVAPASLVAPFGIALPSAVARSEVRAVYGGFGVAMGILLGCAAADVGGVRVGVALTTAVALTGMAFGRLVSRLFERQPAFYPSSFYGCLELLAAAALVFAVRT